MVVPFLCFQGVNSSNNFFQHGSCTTSITIASVVLRTACFLSSQPLFTLHRIFCDLLRRIPGLMAVDSKLGCAPLIMLIFLLQCWFQLPTCCFPWKLSDITEAYWSYSMVKSSAAESRCGDGGCSGTSSGTLRLHSLRFSSELANFDMSKALVN